MRSFPINKFGKVKFFRSVAASPIFLAEHGVLSVTKGEKLDIVESYSQDGAQRLYVVTGWQLRMADPNTMPDRHKVVRPVRTSSSGEIMAQWQAEEPYEREGDQLYTREQAVLQGVLPLPVAAATAAQAAGVRPTAATWFKGFVEDTFFGCASWQEFTEDGVRRPRRSFGSPPSTVQYQLNQLQRRDIMRYDVLPKGDGLYLRFNRQFLPGVDFDKLPLFFATFLF